MEQTILASASAPGFPAAFVASNGPGSHECRVSHRWTAQPAALNSFVFMPLARLATFSRIRAAVDPVEHLELQAVRLCGVEAWSIFWGATAFQFRSFKGSVFCSKS